MHAIRKLMLKTQSGVIRGTSDFESYINSPRFFIKKATEALYSAHFGPKDLRHTNLNRAAKFRQKAFEAKAGKKVARMRHIAW